MSDKALLDANLQAVVESIQASKTKAADNRSAGRAVPWLRPPLTDWNGDLTKWPEIRSAFQTDEAEEALIQAYTPENSGLSSDTGPLTLQIDYAVQMERAYRARTTQSFPRAMAHLAARETGQGKASGPLGAVMNYFNLMIRQV